MSPPSPSDAASQAAAGAPRPVVLVTGAARRLGRAVALHLAQAGWDVAVHFHRSADEAQRTCEELRACGARAAAFRADLHDDAQVRALLPQVAQAFGQVDALVNHASMLEHDTAGLLDSDRALQHWRVNTVAPVLLAQALHAHLCAREARGCAVNLLDPKPRSPNPDHLSCTLSRAALREANALLAQALAPVLRVVAVSGVFAPGSPAIDAQRLHALQAPLPPGEARRVAAIADAVLFALRNRALTACELPVEAGRHPQPGARDFAFD